MRKVYISAIVLIFIGIGIFFFLQQRPLKKSEVPVNTHQEQKDFQQATSFIDQGKPLEALKIIKKYESPMMIHTERGQQWFDLLLKAHEMLKSTPQLIFLYEHFPSFFDSHEKAALLICHSYLDSQNIAQYNQLRERWHGKETLLSEWLCLDADALLLDSKKDDAIKLLSSERFSGKSDVPRLIRLAILMINKNPKQALDLLLEAQNRDATNPSPFVLRAKIFELLQEPEFARFEYMQALQIAPDNPAIADELAEFYRRQGKWALAMQIWKETIRQKPIDEMWIKLLFWNKTVENERLDLNRLAKPQGESTAFIDYLMNLGPNVFWNEKGFEKLKNAQKYLENEQATLWLQVIQLLKDGQESEAYNLLQNNSFLQISWDPILERTLKIVIKFRETGRLPEKELQDIKEPTTEDEDKKYDAFLIARHQFFKSLNDACKDSLVQKEDYVLPQNLQTLLTSKNAYAAIFLAGGWLKTAVILNDTEESLKDFPSWYSFGMTESLRIISGPKVALEYAQKQPKNDSLQLLIAECLIEIKREREAEKILQELATKESDIGFRSAFLLSGLYFEDKEFEKAQEVISSQPLLIDSVVGRELLARIAIASGNKDLAERLYTSILDSSTEAKSYFAQKAFEIKDWKKAKKLTEELLKEHPTNSVLQLNYNKILEEEQKEQTGATSKSANH